MEVVIKIKKASRAEGIGMWGIKSCRPSLLNMNTQPHTGCCSVTATKPSSIRIAVVGDVHNDWDLVEDEKALLYLHPDLVLFTGDFGNENVELVESIAQLQMRKAAILGNHDAWFTHQFSPKLIDGVQAQLQCLDDDHVGYKRMDLPDLHLSVVGARPFSCGGSNLYRKKLLTARYGVRSMDESAHRIHKAAASTPPHHSLVFLAHNGPTGLGSSQDDLCGKDWVYGGGDHGDPDLAQAISLLKDFSNYSIPLVVFGHMHKDLACGGVRKMIAVDAENTMYLNTAVVPRVKYQASGGTTRVFTVVDFIGNQINKVTETWVSVVDDVTSVAEEYVLFSSSTEISTHSAL